jgi:DNA-binding transcriptional regulator YbjK
VPTVTDNRNGRRSGIASSERGAERRAAILAATVRILAAEGLGAVTHRAVAREADVPLAATTYYFASKDELLTEALGLLAGEEMERLQRRAAELDHEAYRSPSALAAEIAETLVSGSRHERDALLAKYEVYLEAARRPALRATARHWIAAFQRLAARALKAGGAPEPERRAQLLVAAVDGILIHQLVSGQTPSEGGEARRRLEGLIVALTRS